MLYGVKVLLFAVTCSPDLLHCQSIRPISAVWDDMPGCHAAAAAMRRETANRRTSGAVVMTDCRYRLMAPEGEAATS